MLLHNLLLFVLLLLSLYCHKGFSVAIDTIHSNQSISDGQTLTSASDRYMLGFFNPNNSSANRYLGIWYNLGSPEPVIIWVANRENPLTDTTGVLGFDEVTSNLVLTDATNRTLWSSNTTINFARANNVTAKLLDYGNLILLHHDGSEMWSSFDQLTDTLLPKSEMSFSLKTKRNNTIINWKSKFDPSSGNFAVGCSSDKFYQGFIYVNGTIPHWRTGPWIGQKFIGVPDMSISTNWYGFDVYNPVSQDAIKIGFIIGNDISPSSVSERLVLNSEGQLVHWVWDETEKQWAADWKRPENKCDLYGTCGEFAICNHHRNPICECMRGFVPRSSKDWAKGSFSGGCKRNKELECKRSGSGDMFFKMEGLKLPDFTLYADDNYNETECKKLCSKECRCLAYTYAYKICMGWGDGLLDVRKFQEGGEVLYVKLHPSALDHVPDNNRRKKLIISIGIVLGAIFFCCVLLLSLRIIRQKVSKEKHDASETLATISQTPILGEREIAETFDSSTTETRGLELLRYDIGKIITATNDFHVNNKLGEGGFGPVYKGVLLGGQQIAVKRLSRRSRQRLKEFKNEVLLISKLQHQNLVHLLGYCINVEENLLIYEFMPNRSLDAFLFGEAKKNLLDWSKRFNIIKGIAQGLLYLHQDSRLRIIHRDLKASNILLDADLNPKISDFGTARIFDMDQLLETNTIVGTHGYISPEYIFHGQFSEKSDVYSFGVLLLEILSGTRISTFYDEQNSLNLLGYAWKIWKEGNVLEFVDMDLGDSWPHTNAMKCMTVALLCVQELAIERPAMSSIVSMLTSTNVEHYTPKEPPFSRRRDPLSSYSLGGKKQQS